MINSTMRVFENDKGDIIFLCPKKMIKKDIHKLARSIGAKGTYTTRIDSTALVVSGIK